MCARILCENHTKKGRCNHAVHMEEGKGCNFAQIKSPLAKLQNISDVLSPQLRIGAFLLVASVGPCQATSCALQSKLSEMQFMMSPWDTHT